MSAARYLAECLDEALADAIAHDPLPRAPEPVSPPLLDAERLLLRSLLKGGHLTQTWKRLDGPRWSVEALHLFARLGVVEIADGAARLAQVSSSQ